MTANDLTQFIILFLNERGWDVWRNNSGVVKTGSYAIHLSPAFSGDIIGSDPDGRYVHIEVKVDNDILSKGQIDTLYKIAKSRYGITCVARTKEQFLKWFHNCKKFN